jgi:Fe-S-cluster containining protein
MVSPMALYDMEEGVRYACQRCGNCCRWPGEVPVSGPEIARIAAFLGLGESEFIARYTDVRLNRTGLTLVSRPNHECIFLDGIDCRIQPVKPDQCAGFPNQWNFPGWRDTCEAIAVPLDGPAETET